MIRHLLLQRQNWDNIAVIENGIKLSYRQLRCKAAAIQKQLPQKQGTNIVIFLPNSGDYIAALFGTFMAGLTAFPLNTQLTRHEIAPLLTQANVAAVITSTKFRPLFATISGYCGNNPRIIYADELPECAEESYPALIRTGANEPMILLSTSGTTGEAKIVQLSEKNVEATVLGFSSYNNYARFMGPIKYILGTPFASVYGLLILSVCLMNSFSIVIPQEAVTVDILFRAAEQYKVTHYEGGAAVPILMDQISGHAIPYDISSLKFIGYGGSKVASDVLRRLGKAFPQIEVCPGYGSTESSSLIARHCKRLRPDKLDAVGIAIPGVKIMVEANGVITGTPCVTGEVVAKGPNIMLGYYKNEEETRKIIKNGYLYTGDMGYLDKEGFLYLCGRKKNVIMVRGFSVYAEEVEDCLLGSGLVKDCLVYGETDTRGNEQLCANIVPLNPQVQIGEIRAYCQSRLARYKAPQKLNFVPEIKKTATGKSSRTTARRF